jgi:hypothetical protein
MNKYKVQSFSDFQSSSFANEIISRRMRWAGRIAGKGENIDRKISREGKIISENLVHMGT